VKECSYFVGNVLVQIKYVFLQDYHLLLPLLKLRDVGLFYNNKKSGSNRGSSLNNSIDNNK